MTIEAARAFILNHQEAAYKSDPRHAKYLAALEAVEQYKREKISDVAQDTARHVAENPNWGRMRR
jgi:hypothetical protein